MGEEAIEPSARRFVDHFVSVAAPGGGLWSTAADLVRFGQAFLRGGRSGDYQLLSPAAIEVMTRLHTGGLVEILCVGVHGAVLEVIAFFLVVCVASLFSAMH